MRGHAAYAHKTVRDGGSEHWISINALAHQFPEELAHQHFIIDDDRYNGSEPLEQLEAQSYEFPAQRRAQVMQSLAAFGLALDYLDRL